MRHQLVGSQKGLKRFGFSRWLLTKTTQVRQLPTKLGKVVSWPGLTGFNCFSTKTQSFQPTIFFLFLFFGNFCIIFGPFLSNDESFRGRKGNFFTVLTFLEHNYYHNINCFSFLPPSISSLVTSLTMDRQENAAFT